MEKKLAKGDGLYADFTRKGRSKFYVELDAQGQRSTLFTSLERIKLLLALIEMTGYRSDMLCFASGVETPLRQARRAASGTAGASAPPAHASAALVRAAQVRDRLMLEVPEEQLRERVEQLVSLSYNNVYTRAYDEFQRWSNGIAC